MPWQALRRLGVQREFKCDGLLRSRDWGGLAGSLRGGVGGIEAGQAGTSAAGRSRGARKRTRRAPPRSSCRQDEAMVNSASAPVG